MSVAQAPVQIGGTAVLGMAGARGVARGVERGLASLPATGGALAESVRTFLFAGAGLLTVGGALMQRGRNHRIRGGRELD